MGSHMSMKKLSLLKYNFLFFYTSFFNKPMYNVQYFYLFCFAAKAVRNWTPQNSDTTMDNVKR